MYYLVINIKRIIYIYIYAHTHTPYTYIHAHKELYVCICKHTHIQTCIHSYMTGSYIVLYAGKKQMKTMNTGKLAKK